MAAIAMSVKRVIPRIGACVWLFRTRRLDNRHDRQNSRTQERSLRRHTITLAGYRTGAGLRDYPIQIAFLKLSAMPAYMV
jgi:hypothetical protein